MSNVWRRLTRGSCSRRSAARSARTCWAWPREGGGGAAFVCGYGFPSGIIR